MKISVALLMLFLPTVTRAGPPFPNTPTSKAPCPQIDPNVKDRDGVPFCPCPVLAESAWSVFRCAVEQATSFHAPTNAEKLSMSKMLEGWQNHKSPDVLAGANELNLQVCRVSQLHKAQPDSFLLIYVKPGIKDYSGPFFMLRETRHSKVLIIGPHDDSDSTWQNTKIATASTLSMGTISNGHNRGKVRTPESPRGYADFVHTPGGPDADLGTYAVEKVCAMNRSSVVLHIHGLHDSTKIMYRARNDIMEKAFEATASANLGIKTFVPLNAYFTIDPLVNTIWYVKAEIPALLHRQDPTALARMVTDIETYDWAW